MYRIFNSIHKYPRAAHVRVRALAAARACIHTHTHANVHFTHVRVAENVNVSSFLSFFLSFSLPPCPTVCLLHRSLSGSLPPSFLLSLSFFLFLSSRLFSFLCTVSIHRTPFVTISRFLLARRARGKHERSSRESR